MKANVTTEFANFMYLGYQCETPITLEQDPLHRNNSCLDVSYAAQAFHDYQRYLSNWNTVVVNESVETTKDNRVPSFSQISDVQVNGTWLEATASELNGRIINNVSLAMPHAGLLETTTDPRNQILQPEELGGLGAYTLTASIPSPVVHVLCVNMDREELSPIVYTAWEGSEELNTSTWPAQIAWVSPDSSINRTVVDDLFGWNKNGQVAPIFSRYPSRYNTLLNQTFFYGRESIYLLGRDPDVDTETYSLCQMKVSLTPNCSTTYNAAQDSASLSSTCDPDHDNMAYIHSDPKAQSGAATVSINWPWIGSEWANSLSLNNGITDGRASIARILTHLILKEPKLSPDQPSLAETLAVLAGSTLLMGTQDAQMDMDWVSPLPSPPLPSTPTNPQKSVPRRIHPPHPRNRKLQRHPPRAHLRLGPHGRAPKALLPRPGRRLPHQPPLPLLLPLPPRPRHRLLGAAQPLLAGRQLAARGRHGRLLRRRPTRPAVELRVVRRRERGPPVRGAQGGGAGGGGEQGPHGQRVAGRGGGELAAARRRGRPRVPAAPAVRRGASVRPRAAGWPAGHLDRHGNHHLGAAGGVREWRRRRLDGAPEPALLGLGLGDRRRRRARRRLRRLARHAVQRDAHDAAAVVVEPVAIVDVGGPAAADAEQRVEQSELQRRRVCRGGGWGQQRQQL